MDLYLLRHGEAGKRMPAGARDRERALTASGSEELEEVGAALSKLEFSFDVVTASPLRRARESADIVNRALRRKGEVEVWPELSPEGSREALYKRLAKMKPDASILVVGHEPYLTGAVGDIIGRGGDDASGLRISLRKAGMAKLSVAGFSPRISGELRWLLTPRQIRRMA